MVQGILIPASEERDMRSVRLDSLEDYQAAVGGWIEAVDLVEIGSTMFVNESGLVMQLAFNRRATFVARYHLGPAGDPFRLAGDAVVVGLPSPAGESTDVPDDVREALLTSAGYRVETRDAAAGEWRADPAGSQSYVEAIVWATLVREVGTSEARVRPA